ncbi:MAG: formyltransferase family protein [Chloroflexota bacterium]|nr:formyltransferase family protein [Chloroflexota bacterium]
MYKIGWFSTGRGAGSRALLTAIMENIQQGAINAELSFVFCNRAPGQAKETDVFFELVNHYSIPLVYVSSQRFKTTQGITTMSDQQRLEYDRQIMEQLQGFEADICVLAGYMLIVGAEMCTRYTMINLHPATPTGPAGTWREVIWQLIDSKASETGVMMHLVTPELDKGPPVTYCAFPIRGEPYDEHWEEIAGVSVNEIMAQHGENNRLFQLIRQEGLKREQPLIVATLKAFSDGKVRIENGNVVDSSGQLIKAYSLTQEIEAMIQAT